jgi:hypothetical protein
MKKTGISGNLPVGQFTGKMQLLTMNMTFKCKYCGGTRYMLRLRVYKNFRYKTTLDPKWLPHIQQYCGNCNRYNATLPQTEELRLEVDGQALFPYDFEGNKDDRIGDIQANIPTET